MTTATEKHDEYQYLDQVEKVLQLGTVKKDRTGTGTVSYFGTQARYSLAGGKTGLKTALPNDYSQLRLPFQVLCHFLQQSASFGEASLKSCYGSFEEALTLMNCPNVACTSGMRTVRESF